MSSWLWIWPPWKEPKTPENNQIVKVSSTQKTKTTPLQQEIIATYTYILVVYSEDEQNTNSSVSSPRGKKIPKPSFAGLPTIKLKQSYYHVYVDYN